MRRLAFTLFLMACLLPLTAQVTSDSAGVRYWFDDNIEAVQTTATGTQRLDISALRPGLHTLHAQVQHADGSVGYIRSETFLIPYVSTDPTSVAASIRYWFDKDFAAAQTTTVGPQRLDISALRPGVHTLHVQVLHTDGSVGYIRSEMFMIPYINSADEASYCRYWFDNDLANVKIATTGVQHLDVFDLTPGKHTLHVQVVHSDGSLGYIRSETFTVPLADGTETFIQVGTGTATGYNIPFNNNYKNSWSQAIYTAQELTRGGTINSLQFHCAAVASGGYVDDDLTIYMAHTTKTVASSTSDWIPEADLVQVYSATSFAHPTDTGWFFIDLQTPFQYNGTDNLAVVIGRHSSNYASAQKYTNSTVESGVVLYRQNDSNTSYGDYPGTNTGTKATTRANTIFGFFDANCHETTLISDTATICANETYLWRGQLYSTAGFYSDTVRTTAGCERIYQLTLNVAPAYTITDSATICEGETYTWHGRTLAVSGIYRDTLLTIYGCDSICVLNLTISEAIDMPATDTMVCEADMPILWHGMTLTTAGTYYDTLHSFIGCDSVHYTLNLTFMTAIDMPVMDTMVCEADLPILWHGMTLASAGTYYDTLRSLIGCDSVRYTLNLIVMSAIDMPVMDTMVCEADLPIMWHGMTLVTAGTYYDTLRSIIGCDSVRYTLNIIVNSEKTSTEQAAICQGESYTWHGREYRTAGVYVDTLQTVAGCDSICTLHLTVNPTYLIEEITSVREDKLPYIWQGETISQSGDYRKEYTASTGCDSVHTLHFTVTALPIYTVVVEADHGHVNGTGTYPEGTQIHLEAVPDEGFEFQMWSDTRTENPKNFTVMQDTTFRAHFFMPEVEQEVTVDSIDTRSVTISWDTVAGATLYELCIYKNGRLIVTFHVDRDNNIINTIFAGPERIIAKRDSTGGSAETLQVDVSGLDPGSDYTYSLDSFGDDRNYVGAQSGSFTTEDEPIDRLDTLFDDRHPEPRKVLREGRLYIEMPDGTLYDARGRMIVDN